MHYGEDTLGEGNYAPVNGTVVYARYDNTGTGLGYAVGVRETAHPDVIWWVAHHASISVSVGEIVSEGRTKLGVKGASGAAQGVHCHTERRVGGLARPGSGTATNPRDYYTSTAGGDLSPLPPERKKSMTTVYWNGLPGASGAKWALAGDSPGTTANWIETGTQSLASAWASVHGSAVNLGSDASFSDFRGWYQQPLNVSGGSGGGGLTAAQDTALMGLPAAIADLPTNGEMGQALTSTVALVNEHADENKDAIIDAIPSGGGSASTYSLNLNIDQVPGTATGTATPQ